jgi:hypothetical protein
MPARTRVFIDALAAKFIGPECQAIEAEMHATKTRLRRTSGTRESKRSGRGRA